MKCITFRRWFPGTGRPIKSWTLPIETEAHKICLAKFFYEEQDLATNFIAGRLDKTVISMPNGNDGEMMLKYCLQIYQEPFYEEGNEDEEGQSIIFAMDTDYDKITFANWVIQHHLGDFQQCNTHVFISEYYVPAEALRVSVPLAEVIREE